MTEVEAERQLAELREHFQTDLVPLTRVCESIFAWADIMAGLSAEEFARAQGRFTYDPSPVTPQAVLGSLPLWMRKSNLLYRLIYLGEPLRTEKCPKHKGHWQGCSWDFDDLSKNCDCQKVRLPDGRVIYDTNVCGWLLEGNPPVESV